MTDTVSNQIMTFNQSLEGIEGVKGAVTVLQYKDGRFDFVFSHHQDPFEYVSAVEHFAKVYFEPDIDERDEEPQELWVLIDELTGKA